MNLSNFKYARENRTKTIENTEIYMTSSIICWSTARRTTTGWQQSYHQSEMWAESILLESLTAAKRSPSQQAKGQNRTTGKDQRDEWQDKREQNSTWPPWWELLKIAHASKIEAETEVDAGRFQFHLITKPQEPTAEEKNQQQSDAQDEKAAKDLRRNGKWPLCSVRKGNKVAGGEWNTKRKDANHRMQLLFPLLHLCKYSSCHLHFH